MAIVQWPVFGHHVEFLKGQNFIWRGGLEDRGTSPCKILLQLVHPSARYCDFRCLKMVAVAILEFLFCEILLSDLVHSSETHHLCKIFRFSVFQDGHLGFPNLQNFIIWLQMLPNFVKKSVNPLQRYCNFSICPVVLTGSTGPRHITVIHSSKSVDSLQRYCDFSFTFFSR